VTATLLAVDDSKTMRKVLEITFAGEDYKMVLADSPADALAKLKAERPVIALVDALLGANNGYDLCQQIKAEAPNVGVIVLSSKQHPYDRVKGGSVGADDFIDKPYDSQALIDKVAALSNKLASAPAARPAAAPAAPIGVGSAKPAVPAAAAAPAGAARTTMSFGAPQPTAGAVAPVKTGVGTLGQPAARPEQPSSLGARPATAQPGIVQPGQASPVARPVTAPGVAPVATAARPVAPVATAAPAPAAPVVAAAPAAAVPVATAGLIPAAALLDASMEGKLLTLGLTKDQIAGVLALSRELLEQVVWEVVPVLAETMIREEIKRLTSE
jgi:CheY-like chemotaxis protein